jgi:hypothetical protein
MPFLLPIHKLLKSVGIAAANNQFPTFPKLILKSEMLDHMQLNT